MSEATEKKILLENEVNASVSPSNSSIQGGEVPVTPSTLPERVREYFSFIFGSIPHYSSETRKDYVLDFLWGCRGLFLTYCSLLGMLFFFLFFFEILMTDVYYSVKIPYDLKNDVFAWGKRFHWAISFYGTSGMILLFIVILCSKYVEVLIDYVWRRDFFQKKEEKREMPQIAKYFIFFIVDVLPFLVGLFLILFGWIVFGFISSILAAFSIIACTYCSMLSFYVCIYVVIECFLNVFYCLFYGVKWIIHCAKKLTGPNKSSEDLSSEFDRETDREVDLGFENLNTDDGDDGESTRSGLLGKIWKLFFGNYVVLRIVMNGTFIVILLIFMIFGVYDLCQPEKVRKNKANRWWGILIVLLNLFLIIVHSIVLSLVAVPRRNSKKYPLKFKKDRISFFEGIVYYIEEYIGDSANRVILVLEVVVLLILTIVALIPLFDTLWAASVLGNIWFLLWIFLLSVVVVEMLYILRFVSVIFKDKTAAITSGVKFPEHEPSRADKKKLKRSLEMEARQMLVFRFLSVCGYISLIIGWLLVCFIVIFVGAITYSFYPTCVIGFPLLALVTNCVVFRKKTFIFNIILLIFFVVSTVGVGFLTSLGGNIIDLNDESKGGFLKFEDINLEGNSSETTKLYSICSAVYETDLNGNVMLDIIDMALLAELSYQGSSNDTETFLRAYFPQCTQDEEFVCKMREETSNPVKFIDVDFGSFNVIAVRGTSSKRDLFQDIFLWKEVGVIQILGKFIPIQAALPNEIIRIILWVLDFSSRVLMHQAKGSDEKLQYANALEKYIIANYPSPCNNSKCTYLTGHSLGGGIAKIVGVRKKKKSIAFASPGIVLSGVKFSFDPNNKFSVKYDKPLAKYAVNIQPDKDLVSRIDILGGSIQKIACYGKNGFECHSSNRIWRELICGCNDRYKRCIPKNFIDESGKESSECVHLNTKYPNDSFYHYCQERSKY